MPTRQTRSFARVLTAAVAIIISFAVSLGPVIAQSAPPAPPAGILTDGNAAVTGFSGAQPPTLIAPGVDPADKTYIDLAGPSTRVIDLDTPGALPQAQLVQATKPFTATAAQVGQVFAVALDNASPPNIYVAATSAYGLPIVVPDKDGDGLPDRVKQGAPERELHARPVRSGGPRRRARLDLADRRRDRRGAPVRQCHARRRAQFRARRSADSPSTQPRTACSSPIASTGMIHALRSRRPGARPLRSRRPGTPGGRAAAGAVDPATGSTSPIRPSRPTNPSTWAYAADDARDLRSRVRAGRLYYAVAGRPAGLVGLDHRRRLVRHRRARRHHRFRRGTARARSPRSRSTTTARCCSPSAARPPAPTTSWRSPRRRSAACCATSRAAQASAGLRPPAISRHSRSRPTSRRRTPRLCGSQCPTSTRSASRPTCATTTAASRSATATRRPARSTATPAAASCGRPASACARPPTRRWRRSSPPAARAIVNGLQGNALDLVRARQRAAARDLLRRLRRQVRRCGRARPLGDIAIWRFCARAVAAATGVPPAPGTPPAPSEPAFPTVEPGGPFGPWLDGWPPLPPPICPVGTHLATNALQCCPPNQIPGFTGACQSPCPNGSMIPADMIACRRGFQPGNGPDAAHGPAFVGLCWNGAPVVKVPGPVCAVVNNLACNKCPKSPLERCPSGTTEVAGVPHQPPLA